jgi:hypothetical protein
MEILDMPDSASKPKHPWKENLVDDPDAPRLYTPQAIMGFSIAYSVLVGAILLSANTRLLKARLWIMAYGMMSTAVSVVAMYFIPYFIGAYFVFNAVAAFGLVPFLWNKSVGQNTKFRPRSIWLPLLLLVILPVLLMISLPFWIERID